MLRLSPRLGIAIGVLAGTLILGGTTGTGAPPDDSSNYVLTQDALNKMVAVLGDLRAKDIGIQIGGGDLDAEVAKLKKQPQVEKAIKKRGLSVREFVLSYKATAQIRAAAKARDNWQTTLQDPGASPQAKLDATRKLAESLKTNLFTPEQVELVRHKMPDLDALLPKLP